MIFYSTADVLFGVALNKDTDMLAYPNRPVIQIQHISPISHNASFVTEMCTCLLQNGALWDISLMHCGICEMRLLSVHVILLMTIYVILSGEIDDQ